MKFLKKLKSSNFWVSMISAVVLILQAVFNVEIKTEYLNQIIMAILGILVMTGIVSDSNNDEVTVSQKVDLEGVKETINAMFAQISTTLQADVTNIVSQFQKLNTTQSSTTEIKNEVAKVQNTVPVEVKNTVVELQSIETDKQQVVEENKSMDIVQQEQTQPTVAMQEVDALQNEL